MIRTLDKLDSKFTYESANLSKPVMYFNCLVKYNFTIDQVMLQYGLSL